jgi:hypothetical protein
MTQARGKKMKITAGIARAVLVAALAAAGCGASPASATPADRVVCHQFFVYEATTATAANPLGTLASQYQSDSPASAAVSADMSSYLLLMHSGGWAPGSGEQQQTAQAGVNVINDCTALHAYR